MTEPNDRPVKHKSANTMWGPKEVPDTGEIKSTDATPTEEIVIQRSGINTPLPRTTVVITGAYQPLEGKQFSFAHSFHIAGINSEQVCERELRINDVYYLNTAWVTKPSCLIISNLEGENLQRIPTDEELKILNQTIIRIYSNKQDNNPIIIRPKQTLVLTYDNYNEIIIVAKRPNTRIRVVAIP